MASSFEANAGSNLLAPILRRDTEPGSLADAENALRELAHVFLEQSFSARPAFHAAESRTAPISSEAPLVNMEAKYRALVEQIPAVIFMAYLDQGIGEAYVSPQIEEALGFSQREWLEDPVRWYQRIHPDDKARWSVEAAAMFQSGKPLRSAYRVVARDGRVRWFHCEAKMIRREDGSPWFIHGVGVDITDLKEDFLFIENVGNLVCPSSYDLGEDLRLVLLSVTEGEDKPLKYPTIFNSADVAVITKLDLAEAVQFDAAAVHRNIQAVRPGMPVLSLSSKTGQGMEDFWEFLEARRVNRQAAATSGSLI